jgi:MFS family permease
VGLFGALGVVILDDVGAPSSASGVVVGSFFLAGACVITVLGPAVDRFGWQRSAVWGLPLTALALIGVVGARGPWGQLVLWLALAGVASSVIQTASSVFLSTLVTPSRRGFAMSAKFAGVPTALMLSGFAVPVVAVAVGWRATYAGAAGLVTLGLLLLLRLGQDAVAPMAASIHRAGVARVRRALRRAWAAMFLGSMLSGVLLGFTVPALVHSGWTPSQAATLYACMSVLAIGARGTVAWLADRPRTDGRRVVAVMLGVGGGGALLVACGLPWAVLLGSSLAFSFGWGWTGEAFHLAVRAHPGNPGAAVSVIQSGGMFGSAAGPLAGAPLDHALGTAGVWLLVGGSCLAAAVLTLGGRAVAPIQEEIR